MNSLENLNLPQDSNLNDQQGNAQLSEETSIKEVENIEQTTNQEVESKSSEQLEEESKIQISETLDDDADSEVEESLELMPEKEEGNEGDDEDEDDEDVEIADDSQEVITIDYSALS
ncbi:MAG: hypothetical protein GX879_03945, partial [Bacteroidales bacterium]|nr:hypothetical protein [Bacteroidales bacterium]